MPSLRPAKVPTAFRFGLPPSLGAEVARDRADRLRAFLERSLGMETDAVVETSYEGLAKDLLAGRIAAAWAPPFVCARVEAMGVRVLLRGVRHGASTYRAALIGRLGERAGVYELGGKRALWVDRDSVGGYLLAAAYLKSRGVDPQMTFFQQEFAGSYRAALDGVAEGRADVTSVFAPSESSPSEQRTGVEEIAPELHGRFTVLAFTDETPNDGIVVSPVMDPSRVTALERALAQLPGSAEGRALLRDTFNAERFEPAPRLGYRALYRVALASL